MDLLTYYSDLAVAYPEYITQKQFCEVCGICHKTAYNLTRRGEISYEIVDTPTGRIHHIKLTDALAYLYKKDTLYGNDENVNRQIYEVLQAHFSYLPDLLRTQQIRELTGFSMWGDRIFEKCGIRRDEGGDGGKTLEIRGKRRLSARDGGANYQQS